VFNASEGVREMGLTFQAIVFRGDVGDVPRILPHAPPGLHVVEVAPHVTAVIPPQRGGGLDMSAGADLARRFSQQVGTALHVGYAPDDDVEHAQLFTKGKPSHAFNRPSVPGGSSTETKHFAGLGQSESSHPIDTAFAFVAFPALTSVATLVDAVRSTIGS
jgi:hypothetical protein